MKKNRRPVSFLLLSGFLLINIPLLSSCSTIKWSYGSIIITIPGNIHLTEDEVRKAFTGSGNTGDKGLLEVTVYSYTAGYESIWYEGEGNFRQKNHNAGMKLLLKLKRGNTLEQVMFITAEGRDKDDMIINLSKKIRGLVPSSSNQGRTQN